VLVGRDEELERIEQVLTGARAGRAVAVVLTGEPGVGKTALLEACAQSADGFRILRTRGVEAEVELPFAALVELLEPLADRIERLPEAQASASTQGVDDLLDEIDGVLESNAEEFVRAFVQKGGQ